MSKPWERFQTGPWARFQSTSFDTDEEDVRSDFPEEEESPSFDVTDVLGIPEPRRPANVDVTDDARATRGLGRSAYLSDGTEPQMYDGGMIRPEEAPQPNPDNPEGTGLGRAVRRGGLRAASSLPIALATADATAIADSRKSEEQLIRDVFLDATGLDAIPEGSDLSTPETAAAEISRMGFPAERPVLFRELLQSKRQNAADVAANPSKAQKRFAENAKVAGSLLSRAKALPMSPGAERFKERLAQDTSLGGSLLTFIGNPSEAATFLGEVAGESVPMIAASLTTAAVTKSPGAGVLAMGAGALTQEFGSSVDQFLSEKGLSLDTPENAMKVLNSPEILQDAARVGVTRGLIIAAAEATGQGVAVRQLMKSPIGDAIAQTFVQSATGGGGEALAQLGTGQKLNPQEILIEALAETVTAPLEVGGAAVTAKRSDGRRDDDDPDRPNSPRLTDADRASPVPNAIIDDGKAAIEDMIAGRSPRKPNDGIAPLDDPGGLTARVPQPETKIAAPRVAPLDPAEPTKGEVPLTSPPSERNLSEPFAEVDGDTDTGRTVQLDLDTGEIVEVTEQGVSNDQASETAIAQTQEPVAPTAVPSPLDTVANEGLPAQIAPRQPVTPPKVNETSPRVPTVQKKPLAQTMKGVGVKPGSPLAQELNARGIDGRSHPGLFRGNGATDWDNIPAADYQDIATAVGEDGNGYLDQNGLIDALDAETRGDLLPIGEQAMLRAAKDAKEAQARFEDATESADPIDVSAYEGARSYIPSPDVDISTPLERVDAINRDIKAALTETKLSGILTAQEQIEIFDGLDKNGGNAEDAIWHIIHRGAEIAAPTQDLGSRSAEGGSPVGAPQDGGRPVQPEVNARSEEGSQPGSENGQRRDVSETQSVDAPIDSEQVALAAAEVNTAPTDAQKEAGNFKKGRIKFAGFDITIENPKDSIRSKTGKDGKKWSVKMPAHYGDIKRTEGADGDNIDVYVGEKADAGTVFVVDQMDAQTGKFDEHKAFLGFGSEAEVIEAHNAAFSDGKGPQRRSTITEMPIEEFKAWVKDGDTKTPLGKAEPVTEQTEAGDQISPREYPTAPKGVSIAAESNGFFRVDVDGQAAGAIKVPKNGEGEYVEAANLEPPYQGKRFGHKAYDLIEKEIGRSLVPSPTGLSVNARGFWKRRLSEKTDAERQDVSDRMYKAGRQVGVPAKDVLARIEQIGLPTPTTTERTEAGTQTVIPGAEQSTDRSDKAREADQRRETDARAQQSKMRTSAPQDAPGGLFETQGDLLDAAERSEKETLPADKPKSKTQTRLEEAYRKAWTEREDLPDGDDAAFVEATQKVRAAGEALEGEYGADVRKAALEQIEAGYQSKPDQEKSTSNTKPVEPKEATQTKVDQETPERLEDLGEKIGGARKDTSTPTGPRKSTKAKDERPASQRRYEVSEVVADAFNKGRVGKFTISDTRSKHGRIKGFGRGKLDFDTREEAEAAIPFVAVSRNHRIVKLNDEFEIIRDVTDRKRPTVKGGFKTREEAMAYMAANAEEIAETKLRIDDNIHPALDEAIRKGDERRENGRDVTGQDFMDVFGFRGVEFGNWNNNAERRHLLNQAYDAFLDMAEITGMSPKALSLHGEMGLAFGARGHGLSGARAHYERNYGVINLTKIKGAGSLAHEWFHAMDHYFARQDGKASPRSADAKEGDAIYDAKTAREDYVSHGFRYKSGMREEVRNEILKVMSKIMKRKAEYTEDQSSREKVSKRQIERVNSVLDGIEKVLSTEQSYGKKKAPATEAQMKRFKQAALKIRAAKDLGEMVEAPTKAQYASFQFYKPVMEIAEIYKEVRGRQAYGQTQGRKTGYAVDLQNAIETRNQAQQFLDDAKAEKVKEKTVASEFYSEAWKLDQGSAKDYWSTNHELAARAFESYVYDRLKDVDARNDFLSYEKRNDLPEYKLFGVKPYPEGQERKDINAAFEKLFEVIESKDDGDAVMLYQRPLDMFYSPMLKAVSSAKQTKAPAKDWKAIIAKLPGVKKIEMEWLGVEEWLDAQEGQQVPREALVEFIRDSQIEIVEDRQTDNWAKSLDDYEIDEALGDDLPPEPDFRIETSEPDWPDEDFFKQEAEEIYLDEAREELEMEMVPEDISDADVMDRAVELAEQRYEPTTYSARLYNYEDDGASGVPQEYTGHFDVYERAYYFHELSDADLTESDAISEANGRVEVAIETLRSDYVEKVEAERKAEESKNDYSITGRSQHESYTEDGGDNYREVLLRVPDLHKTGANKVALTDVQQRQWDDVNSRIRASNEIRPISTSPEHQEWKAENEALRNERDGLAEWHPTNKSPFVQRHHFDQENIVVHARVKDRQGANGEKVLFVEEIQSDLASVWRENQESPEVTARRGEIREEIADLVKIQDAAKEDMARLVTEQGTPATSLDFANVIGRAQVANSQGIAPEDNMRPEQAEIFMAASEADNLTLEEIIDRDARIGALRNESNMLGTQKSMDPSTPDTPFKQEHTYNLMVKRLLRMAAEGGYDRLSWTPGYMQAERWDNAAQSVVERVDWAGPDTKVGWAERPFERSVRLQMSNNNPVNVLVDGTGIIQDSTQELGTEIHGKRLSQLVGPDLAKQIMSEESGSVSNQKITFPDSGYAIAYDQQTKRAVDKFAKKFGARVQVDKSLPDMMPTAGQQYIHDWVKSAGISVEDVRDALIRADGPKRNRARAEDVDAEISTYRSFNPPELETSIAARLAARWSLVFSQNHDGFANREQEGNPVWSIDITPELREAAMEPMSMFRRTDINAKRGTQMALDGDLSDLRADLDKMGLKEVDLGFAAPDSTYQGALRIDRKGGMTMLIGASMDKMNTLRHEAIHALRAMNLFTDKEWATLSQAAEGWIGKHSIAERYPDLSRLEQMEEAIAEEFGAWNGKTGGAFAKIRNFLDALGNFLRGRGFNTVEDIFDMSASGNIGMRPRDMAAEGMKYQRPSMSDQGRATTAQRTNTAHIPAAGVYNASQKRTNALMRVLSNTKGDMADKIDRFRVLFQDQMIHLRRAEEMIAAHTGQDIDKEDSAYYAEERYSGRVGKQLDVLRETYIEPIAQEVGRNAAKLSLVDHNGETRKGAEAVSLYLWARHAKERNKRIRDIKGGDSGSGLTDAQADAILQRAQISPSFGIMQRVGALTDQLGAEMIDTRVNAGLLTQAEAQIWKAQYKHYVPLKGFAETDMFDAVGSTPMAPRGRRFNVAGKESKMALGRDSESFDQLSNMIAQAEEVIVRAEKNVVGKTLHNLIQSNPAPGIWEIKDLETRKVYNKASGRVETQILNAAQVQLQPDEMAVKIDGEEKRIKFNDPRLARALGQLGVDGLGPVARLASKFSRYFSAVNTMLSPPFVIVNGFRDMITAQFNLGQLPPGIRGKLRRKANPLSPAYWKSMGGVYSGLGRGAKNSEYAKWFKEFEEVGAKVSFWNIENPQARKDTLERMIKNETGGNLRRALRKGTRLNTEDNPALGWIERVNLMVDNSTRLAVYVEARNQGMSKAEAASLSKNLTVNFNRRGELGATMNAWYPFANAAVQGSHVLLKAAKSRNVQALMGGAFMTGFLNEMLNATLSEEDEDGELAHDKIPNYISERNLIISTGGDSRITIPLPYGFNVPFYAGQQMAKVWRGVKPAGEATGHVAAATFASFSPIAGEDVASTLAPTLLDHVRDLDKNEDWQGRPIRPEQAFGDYGPQSYKEWNVPSYLSITARALNNATGGSPIESGAIDISPEYMHHTLKFLGGGAGRFLDRATDTATKLATGEEIEGHRVPLLRVVRYEPSDWLNQGRYFEFREKVEESRAAAKTAAELRIPIERERLNAAGLYGRLRTAEKARKALSQQISGIYANESLTERQKRDRVKPLQDQRNKVYEGFNRDYIRAMGPQSE